MEPADVLEDGADIIEKEGHGKGNYFVPGQGYCALGALGTAAGVFYDHDQSTDPALKERFTVYAEAADALAELVTVDRTRNNLDNRRHLVPAWNDAPERTKQEVLDALRKAAKLCRT